MNRAPYGTIAPHWSGSVHTAASRWIRQYLHDAEVRSSDAAGDGGRVPEEGAKRATRPPCDPSQAVAQEAEASCRSCADTGFQRGCNGAMRYSGLRAPPEKLRDFCGTLGY